MLIVCREAGVHASRVHGRGMCPRRTSLQDQRGRGANYSPFRELVALPSELPRLDGLFADNIYIINLDREVLTMNRSVHWKLGNIPRQNKLWLHAIKESVYRGWDTISLETCPEEHIASPALEFPKQHKSIKYDYRVVTPGTDIAEARKAFLTHVLACVFVSYRNEIITFEKEWSPDSFLFRGLTFALVSIASGQAKFHSFPAQPCNPRTVHLWACGSRHLPRSPGWLGKEWAGDSDLLVEFGSLCHRPGERPGASPAETLYWLEDVLVSLVLVVDGNAITNAVTWGINQRRASFQLVVLSLFKVVLAEVSFSDDKTPFVRVSEPVNLSPLQADEGLSTYPRERPEWKPGMRLRLCVASS